jgi:hypothetical protein
MKLPKDELRLQELRLLRNYARGELRQEIDRELSDSQADSSESASNFDGFRVRESIGRSWASSA